MSDEVSNGLDLRSGLAVGFVVTLLLVSVLLVVVTLGNETVFSAYASEEADANLRVQQVTDMHEDMGDAGYRTFSTVSTPMLVNDWDTPHRTLLVMTAIEKPLDASEARQIHDFVTEKGGKVIIADDGTNAQKVADLFGLRYFGDPLVDPNQYYETSSYELQTPNDASPRNIYSTASLTQGVADMGDARSIGCTNDQIDAGDVERCVMPLMFQAPTAIQILQEDQQTVDADLEGADVHLLSHASTGAFLATDGEDYDINNQNNAILGGDESGLIVRIDVPGIEALDVRPGVDAGLGTVRVTGSILFVADEQALSNLLWEERSDSNGVLVVEQCSSDAYRDHNCWSRGANGIQSGESEWRGNGVYFEAIIRDMMEFENEEISSTVRNTRSNFNIVFDESRHDLGAFSTPFSETMSAIVLLTSDTLLKWLIVLNLVALLSIAIMVVPEKENWRHVFDLTRFRERPTKIDPARYQQRARETLLSKVRQFHDLTRDELARKTPAEIQTMIKDPRLIELAYTNNQYSPDDLRQLLQQVRRWGK